MGGDNFDKSSKGEIIDFYEADRLFREYVESEYDTLIWDIHELIKRAASNGGTTLRIVKKQGENIEEPVSEHRPFIPGRIRRVVNGFFFAKVDQPTTTLGSKLFSSDQIRNAQDQVCAYFTKLGYDVVNAKKNFNNMSFTISWDRVDRRKFP